VSTLARSAEHGSIFVSYRRDDTRHLAGRLYDRLADRFGSDHIFMDVDSIEPGVDFTSAINDAVSSCNVVLALIGPAWLSIQDDRGRRRLDDPEDFVVLEIAAALSRGIRVVPVLIDGASSPRPEDLPATLTSLARRNAIRLDHETFRSDADVLLAAVARIFQAEVTDERAQVAPPPQGPPGDHGPELNSQLPGKTNIRSGQPAESRTTRPAAVRTSAPRVEPTASRAPEESGPTVLRIPNDRGSPPKSTPGQKSVPTQETRRLAGLAKSGDRHLPARDRGPVPAYIRDVVDSRPRLLGLFMPLALVVVGSVLVPAPSAQQYMSLFSLVMLILMIGNGVWLGRTTVAKVRAKFPNTNISPTATGWYAFSRAAQLRRLRKPPPRVARGQYP
jgi:hypothetical protein